MSKKDKEKLPVEDSKTEEVASNEVADEKQSADDVELPKTQKLSKAEKKSLKSKAGEKHKSQKEWEDSIVSNKRVKREENRHKIKVAMICILIFALITTSTVYLMLLFVEENSIRITASNGQSYSMALSMDRENWSPYLSAPGPKNMWNVSYNTDYDTERVPNVEDARGMVTSLAPILGVIKNDNFINFSFVLKNTTSGTGIMPVIMEMSMKANDSGLEKAMRVMWSERFDRTGVVNSFVYAVASDNTRLAGLTVNAGKTENFVEMIAYPIGSGGTNGGDNPTDKYYNPANYEKDTTISDDVKHQKGFLATTPFYSNNQVFLRNATMQPGEMLIVNVVIWIEGSDYDCTDDKLKGSLSLSINFKSAE